MRVTSDRAADAAYIYVTEIPKGGVAASALSIKLWTELPCMSSSITQNRLIGIEVLGASRGLSAETLETAEQL